LSRAVPARFMPTMSRVSLPLVQRKRCLGFRQVSRHHPWLTQAGLAIGRPSQLGG